MLALIKEFAGQNYSLLLVTLLVGSSLYNDRVIRLQTEGLVRILARKKILEAEEVADLYSHTKHSVLGGLIGEIL